MMKYSYLKKILIQLLSSVAYTNNGAAIQLAVSENKVIIFYQPNSQTL